MSKLRNVTNKGIHELPYIIRFRNICDSFIWTYNCIMLYSERLETVADTTRKINALSPIVALVITSQALVYILTLITFTLIPFLTIAFVTSSCVFALFYVFLGVKNYWTDPSELFLIKVTVFTPIPKHGESSHSLTSLHSRSFLFQLCEGCPKS